MCSSDLLALAAECGADLAIALDPDADRCAIGIPDTDGWRMLRGDQTGALLGAYVLSTLDRTATPDPLVATTIVSSQLLHAIATEHGARYAETLTGFKWLVRSGDGLVFAYEEALGLCVDPDAVRDKDGISAAIAAADLVVTAKAGGRSVRDLLDAMAVAHGVYVTDQVSPRFTDLREIGVLMAKLRQNPPTTLAGGPVTTEDLQPDADVFRLRGDGLRVVVRPSGTEPKLKAYLEIIEPVRTADELAAAQGRAADKLAALHAEIASLLSG